MKIESFDLIDDVWNFMREQNEAADARTRRWQQEIKPGDYFRRPTEHGFYIYGLILEENNPREPGLENYRLSKCYSAVCPYGEMGDIHVSTIEKLLTEEEFLAAQKRGWSA